jgi:hypothetical protein
MQGVQGVQEYKEFRSSGVQEFRSSGVQEFRSSGVQEFRSSGVQDVATSENSRKTLFWEIENGRPPGLAAS